MNIMSDDNSQPTQPRGSLEFVEDSILDTVIPSSTDLNIEENLGGYVERLEEGTAHPLSSIVQRHTLFFGKLLFNCESTSILLIHSS
jgi:hypothetical protein